MTEQLYAYRWGNNPKRATLKGRTCRVLGRAKMNTCLIEFVDGGQREIVSRNAIRKVTPVRGAQHRRPAVRDSDRLPSLGDSVHQAG